MFLEPSDRLDLNQLINDSCAWGDHGESAGWVTELCTEDFELHGPGTNLSREQFRDWIARRAEAPFETRHQVTNLRIVRDDGDHVDLEWLECVHRLDEGSDITIRTVGDVADSWRRTTDGWRLASRTITPVFDAPPAYWGRAEATAANSSV